MKLLHVIAFVLLALNVWGLDGQLENIDQTFSAPVGSVEYNFGEWISNLRCLIENATDCALSIHVNGRRIDGLTHNTNEDVFVSCATKNTVILLITHNFSYADVQNYICLDDVTQEVANMWLTATPVIETSGAFIHNQQVSLTCNAPLGSPLYWVLPGSPTDHSGLTITDTSNSVNSSSTVTFTLQNSDHFAPYKCCISSQIGQPPSNSCVTYTVADNDSNRTLVSTEDYSTTTYEMTVTLQSNPLPDPTTVTWYSCYYAGNCWPIGRLYYRVQDDPSSHSVSTQLKIDENTLEEIYLFTVNTTDDSALYWKYLYALRSFYFPRVTQQPTTIYYNQDATTNSVVLKFTVDANPAPTIAWFKQTTRKGSNGTEPIVSGGRYTVKLNIIKDTEVEATLLINPYDVNEDDAIFTIQAENMYGSSSIATDTSIGPSYLNLKRNSNSTGNYSFTCEFESFPYPPVYEINVVAPYDTNYTVLSQTLDPMLSKTSVNVEAQIDPRNQFFKFSCTAYHPYNSTNYLTKTLTTVI